MTQRELRPPPVIPLREKEGVPLPVRALQAAVRDATSKSRGHQQAKGKKLHISLGGAGSASFAHGLGRLPQGWNVMKMGGAAVDIYEVSRTTKLLTVNVSGACNIDLWVW